MTMILTRLMVVPRVEKPSTQGVILALLVGHVNRLGRSFFGSPAAHDVAKKGWFQISSKALETSPGNPEKLKRHSGLDLERTRRHKVSAAKRGKKVIEGDLVRDVHRRESQGHLRMLSSK